MIPWANLVGMKRCLLLLIDTQFRRMMVPRYGPAQSAAALMLDIELDPVEIDGIDGDFDRLK